MENENKKADHGAAKTIRIILFSLLLCGIMCATLAAYVNIVPDKLAQLAEKGNMDNTIWLVRYTSYLPPIIILAMVLTFGYKFNYVKIESQREKSIIIVIVTAFTYVVLFPIVCMLQSSGVDGWNEIVSLGKDGTVTVFAMIVRWICVQMIPLAITLTYHIVRASSEKKELLENEEQNN